MNQVKLGEQGWKQRYYSEKFMANTSEEVDEIQKSVVRILSKHQVLFFQHWIAYSCHHMQVEKFTEGLCWVMRYYYEGVCSWQW